MAVASILSFGTVPAFAQAQLSTEVGHKIDELANDVLAKTGTPSVSVVVVKDGQIVYLKAYGNARLDPPLPATPEMRYCLGALSKPFTAEAILMLQEQHKLSLDDKVSRFLPDLTRADEVTIRQVLAHTSGYQEFWPVDYVLPRMLQPVAPRTILDEWARRPLRFDPGTQWALSDTNYVIAAAIVEKASGMPLVKFLKEKLFTPLGMQSVVDVDHEMLGETDPGAYMRYGLGPLRVAPREAHGWLSGGEQLAMTAQDLGKWDISIITQRVMTPSSFHEFESDVPLKNGLGTRMALGNGITRQAGHRALYSIGDVSGFSAANTIFLDEGVAVAVLSNLDAGAPGEITRGIVPLLLAKDDPDAKGKLEQARKIFDGLQHGTVDRSLFTDNANSYFSEQALRDYAAGLAPLGLPQEFNQTDHSVNNGMSERTYRIKFAQKTLSAHMSEMPGGKLEQYIVEAD